MSFVAITCRENCADYLARADKEQSPLLRARFTQIASDWLEKAQEWERKYYQTTTEEA